MDTRAGFTLVELMVVVALVAISATIAVPSLSSIIRNNRAATLANTFVGGLHLARTAAVKRGAQVMVCARSNGADTCSNGNTWQSGWLVFVNANLDKQFNAANDTLLKVFPALTADASLSSNGQNRIAFGSDGSLDRSVNTAEPQFSLQIDGCTGKQKRTMHISYQGRISMRYHPC